MTTAIFDLDGTLMDTLQDLADAVNYGLRELGYPEHPTENYKKMVGNGASLLCFRALPVGRKDDTNKLRQFFSNYYSEHYLDKTVLYPNIKSTLKKMYENDIKLAIATNKPHDFACKIISELLPDINFVKIIGGCKEREKKPNPAIIRDILCHLPGADDNTIYMIGDSNVDIQTAKNSNLISIGCCWGFRSRDELKAEGADYLINSVEEILTIILK